MIFITNKIFLDTLDLAIALSRPLDLLEKEIELGLLEIPIYKEDNGQPKFYYADVKTLPNCCELLFKA